MFAPLQLQTVAEILVVVLIFGIVFGLPVGVVTVLRRRKRRIAELTERVDELESRLDDGTEE